ncbi:MAG: apolipoprotein N-acyltransferase [Candidatus Hydrogenedentes bacterium]|nr:apolipoprotein N-acyltransferase [Candidatus Hydrogenedentota bacterium]
MKKLLHIPGIPLACGVGLALCFPTFHCFPLAWIILVPVFAMARNASPIRAASIFLLCGWAFHTILLQWLGTNIYWAGGWAVLGMQGLCLALTAYWAALGVLWNRACRHLPPWLGAPCLAALWPGMEWLHSWNFTGFGWSALGYSQGPDLAFAQLASLGGVSFLSFFIVLVNALLAEVWLAKPGRWARLAAAAILIAVAHLAGAALLGTPQPRPEPLRAGLFQPNYSQQQKYDWEYTEDMVWRAAEHSRALIRETPVELFVWPEALVMNDYQDTELLELLQQFTRETGADLFTGTVRYDTGNSASYNSSVLILRSGEPAGHYDKVHLAPFGEYLPFASLIPFLRAIVPGDVDFGAGQKVLVQERCAIGPLICFEVLFPPMAAALRAQGADVLAVITNLGWFGASNGPAQEWEIARFRAIETRLPLIHSANSGVSGVIDPWGRYEVVDKVLVRGNRVVRIHPDYATPSAVVQQRRLGAFDVPQAAPHPWPAGPQSAPWILGTAGLLMALHALLAGRRAQGTPAPR